MRSNVIAAGPFPRYEMLPPDLSAAIDSQISSVGTREIARASAELTDWYRAGRPVASPFRMTAAHRLAYAAARMPATFAADMAVLQELRLRLPDVSFLSQLDLCAGPGTAPWAAVEFIEELKDVTLFEQDPGFIALGRALAAASEYSPLQEARWQQVDLATPPPLPPHDLVTVSYGLGELSQPGRRRVIEAGWQAAQQAFVIIEPGTPAGFSTILEARRQLIEIGARMAGPCPHERECPLAGTERWCHFAQRLSRSRLHRSAKGAALGYEDEKYSYVIASRSMPKPFSGRIIGVPRESKPAILMELCGTDGLKQETIAKRDREQFRHARRKRWGDAWGEE